MFSVMEYYFKGELKERRGYKSHSERKKWFESILLCVGLKNHEHIHFVTRPFISLQELLDEESEKIKPTIK